MMLFLLGILQTLDIFWKGMLSIFVVVGVIMLVVWLLNRIRK